MGILSTEIGAQWLSVTETTGGYADGHSLGWGRRLPSLVP